MSETAKHRDRADVQLCCQGNGIDVGSAGSPVVPWAIQTDLPHGQYRAYNGSRPEVPIHWRGDALDLPFKDGTLSFAHISHVLEDYEDWWPALREWDRVLMVGGFLLIAVPDHERFRARIAKGQGDNLSHKHESRVGELTEMLQCSYNVFHDGFVGDGDEYSVLFIGKKARPLPETAPVATSVWNVPWPKK